MEMFQDFGAVMGMEDDDDGLDLDLLMEEDMETPTTKECTGRWTREEHMLFIKGLEMYGKGWKKIAGLIKTRTVVQIRTHAQKYFLKLSKARQNGESSGSMSMDGKTFSNGMKKKKLKRKFSDRPVAVAAPLKPFISGDNSAEGQIDVDSGLYNFLSPSLAPDGHEEVKEIIIQSAPALERSQSEIIDASEALQPIIERRKVLRSSVSAPPEWYQKGREIEALLKEAESLDWEREKFAAAVAVLTNQKIETVKEEMDKDPNLFVKRNGGYEINNNSVIFECLPSTNEVQNQKCNNLNEKIVETKDKAIHVSKATDSSASGAICEASSIVAYDNTSVKQSPLVDDYMDCDREDF